MAVACSVKSGERVRPGFTWRNLSKFSREGNALKKKVLDAWCCFYRNRQTQSILAVTQLEAQQGNIKAKVGFFSWCLNSQRTLLINFTFKSKMGVKGPVNVGSLLYYPGDSNIHA